MGGVWLNIWFDVSVGGWFLVDVRMDISVFA